VAQFTIKWPNGAELTYEGDVSFAELVELLDQEAPPLLAMSGAAQSPPLPRDPAGGGKGTEDGKPSPVDFAHINSRFQEIGARTDVERITIMAQIAVDAGAPGLDIPTAENWYRELGLRMPGLWRSTFANAQTRGYIKNVSRGVWAPTAPGENFARHGERRPSAARKKRPRTKQGATS
jgi:hypothetical protein